MSLPIAEVSYMDDIIKNNQFCIPYYQRSIEWNENQAQSWFDDLLSVYEGKEADHFLGQIVTYPQNGRLYLVDGQQRTLTSMICIASIKQSAYEMIKKCQEQDQLTRNLRDILRDIVRDSNKVMKTSESYEDSAGDSASLTLQDHPTQAYLTKILYGKNPVANSKDKQPIINMSKIQEYFTGRIQDMLNSEDMKNDSDSQAKFLSSLLDVFFRRTYLSMLIVKDKRAAFSIFMTLNSRGKNLAASDLIKTHLLSFADNKEDANQFRTRWSNVSSRFNDNTNDLTDYITNYWKARSSHSTKQNLFNPISEEVSSRNQANDFLSDLSKTKDVYYAMCNPKTKIAKDLFQDKRIFQRFNDLRTLRIRTYYPIILAMYYHDYQESEIFIVANKILALLTRYSFICGNGPFRLDTGFAKIARHIWKNRLPTAQSIIDYLDSLNVSDKDVDNELKTWSKTPENKGTSQKVIKHLLFRLTQYQTDDFIDDDYEFNNFDIVALDEVDDYKIPDLDDRGNLYSDYLANRTIVEKDITKQYDDPTQLDNESLIEMLSKSRLQYNRNLSDTILDHDGRWGVNDIQRYQDEFRHLAPRIWH